MSALSALDPELKARWVAALRSGEYRQTRHTLKDAEGYCCLGVLCHVAPDQLGLEPQETEDEIVFMWRRQNGLPACDDADLPLPVLSHIRLSAEEAGYLTSMNDGTDDSREHSFAEIADYIERAL